MTQETPGLRVRLVRQVRLAQQGLLALLELLVPPELLVRLVQQEQTDPSGGLVRAFLRAVREPTATTT